MKDRILGALGFISITIMLFPILLTIVRGLKDKVED